MTEKIEKSKMLKKKELLAIKERECQRLKNLLINNRVFVIEVVLCILLIVFHAIHAGHTADFHPINGTFQNFNPVRRLLDGQIPYRDFQDYLGMGHLYTGSLFTLIFGGTYCSSLMGFSFLTLASFAVISYIIGRVVLGKKEYAIAITNLLIVLVLVEPYTFSKLSAKVGIQSTLRSALDVGNSARLIRGMVLPISCGMILAASKATNYLSRLEKWKFDVIVGIVAGFCFVWSNDYGISCWVCLAAMTFWFRFCAERNLVKALKHTGIELIFSILAVFIAVEIFTVGHFGNWVSSTFGTGSYQKWYYNSSKTYYLFDIDTSFPVLLQAGLCICYLIRMFINPDVERKGIGKNTILAYMNMVCFCAVQEYRMLSGGDSREVSSIVLLLTVFYELCHAIVSRFRKVKVQYAMLVFAFLGCIAWLIYDIRFELAFYRQTDREGIYVESMGGYMTSLGEDLQKTNDFLKSETFFSTYASGQELMSGTYQPSGTDYIIHVLGDDQRKKYMNQFENGDFKYAATIRETFTHWEYWIQRANWFFYRNLYMNWHPVYANTYEMFWERNDSDDIFPSCEAEVEIVDVDEHNKIIKIHTSPDINGIADVLVDYTVKRKNNRSAMFMIYKQLRVVNSGSQSDKFDSNFLRSESREYIPIPVVNGYGEVTLTSCPESSTYLELRDCEYKTIYTVTSDYLVLVRTQMKDGELQMVIENTAKNRNAVDGIREIQYQGRNIKIKDSQSDEDYIYLQTEENALDEVDSDGGNIIHILR